MVDRAPSGLRRFTMRRDQDVSGVLTLEDGERLEPSDLLVLPGG